MVKVQVHNTSEGFRCLTDKSGGGSKIAVPPNTGPGAAPRVEVTRVQFADCWPELLKLCKRGTLVLEATNGEVTQTIPFEFAANHFGLYQVKGGGWAFKDAPAKKIEPPRALAPIEPPPGFTPLVGPARGQAAMQPPGHTAFPTGESQGFQPPDPVTPHDPPTLHPTEPLHPESFGGSDYPNE